MNQTLTLTLILLALTGELPAQGFALLPSGHSHNDYTRSRPLYEALEQGFLSLEIDVFLHKNRLVVSHVPLGLGFKKDLETLYLKPLQEIVAKNAGMVWPEDSTQLILKQAALLRVSKKACLC